MTQSKSATSRRPPWSRSGAEDGHLQAFLAQTVGEDVGVGPSPPMIAMRASPRAWENAWAELFELTGVAGHLDHGLVGVAAGGLDALLHRVDVLALVELHGLVREQLAVAEDGELGPAPPAGS
jgi:hypothetical protein